MEKKCIITFYNPNIKSPPYGRIVLEDMVLNQPENDDLGEKFAAMLSRACHSRGYDFKFYSMAGDYEGYDYEVVVYEPNVLPKRLSRKLKLDKIENR